LILGLALAFLPCAGTRPAGAAGENPIWTGWVRDLLGRGIPGVEVWVLPAGAEEPPFPTRTVRTDPDGRIELPDLPPGRHIVALSKPGYRILLAPIHTRFSLGTTLVLAPLAAASTEPPGPGSMDWVLRVPRTDVLKEWTPMALMPPAESASGEARSGRGGTGLPAERVAAEAKLPLNGEVQQWFTSQLPFDAGDPRAADSSGRTTALAVSGDLGGKGLWRVRGLTDSLVTEAGGNAAAGNEDRGASRLLLSMRYDAGPGDSLQFRARFDRDRFRGVTEDLPLLDGRQEVRTFGYEADWTRKVGSGDGLSMSLGFLEANGRVPEESAALRAPTGVRSEEESFLEDRRWNVGARYGFRPAPEHSVSVSARTRLFDREGVEEPGWVLGPDSPQVEMPVPTTSERGWLITVSGEDAWRIADPLRLVLAVDYHRAATETPASILVPRLGVKSDLERTTLEGTLLIRLEDLQPDSPGGTAARLGGWEDTRIGFRAQALHRFGAGWSVVGHLLQNPVEPAGGSSLWENREALPGEASGPFLLAEPGAESLQYGVEVRKKFRNLEGWIGSDRGTLTGKFATRVEGAPIQILEEGSLDFLALHAAASLPRTDTEIRLDLLRIAEDAGRSVAPVRRTSRVGLVVSQEVPIPKWRGPADWRILFACQSLEREPFESDLTGNRLPAERIRRISGGLGVTF
jgi:hypothetical protein